MQLFKNKTLNNKQLPPFKGIIIIALAAFLTACASSAPTHLTVSPTLNLPQGTAKLYNNEAQLEVIDLRIAKFIVSISKEDEAATILSPYKNLEVTTQNKLQQAWQSQGLKINPSAKNTITVTITDATVAVKQSTMSYIADSQILMTVKIAKGNKVLTSKFKNTGSSDGALSVDIAVLERDFNYNYASVLKQIIRSKDIQDFLAP